jgi:iron complex transport system ATP-binding protein
MELQAKNISVSIAGKKIFSEITPIFPKGRCIAIIGANGAGKSTLLRVLAALHSDYQGEIFLGGKNIREINRKEIARHIAILPQTMQAPPDTTVARLIDYGRFPYRGIFSGGNPKEDREATEWAISVVNLEKFKDRQVNSLSGGERQRARIAMALAQRPEIILFDEPTTYLDISHQLEVMQIIRLINEKFGMTVIMVLHDINHALQYADEVIVLKDCKIFQGSPKEIINAEMLADVFGVKADIFTNSLGASVLFPISTIKR